jgi:hypothetical protein
MMSFPQKRIWKGLFIPTIFGILLLSSAPGLAQQFSVTETEKRYREAFKILSVGIEALGGREKLEQLRDLSFRYKGRHTALLQNVEPDFSKNPLEKSGHVIIDLANDRILFEDNIDRAGHYTGWHRYLLHGNKGWDVNLRHRPIQYRNASADPIRQGVYTMLPQLTLLQALKSLTTLRFLGQTNVDGKAQDIISFSAENNREKTLFFDRATGLLTKVEMMEAFPVYGDRVREHRFRNYRKVGELLLPHHRTSMLSGVPLDDLTYSDISVNSGPAESVFALPEGSTERDDNAQRAQRPEAITKWAAGIYTLDNVQGTDNRILFVTFDDYVLVAGAPFGLSEKVIAKIKETVPDKPIRYVLPTHHCYSHGGGLRPYIAEGVTIVTTPGNKTFVEQMANAPHTLRPDKLAQHARSPRLEIIHERHRTFEDQTHQLEVYDIGPTSHAKEMLIVYFPALGILYQGDLLELDDDDPISSYTANDVTVDFYERLKQMNLRPKIIIGTEGREASFEDLEKAIEMKREP